MSLTSAQGVSCCVQPPSTNGSCHPSAINVPTLGMRSKRQVACMGSTLTSVRALRYPSLFLFFWRPVHPTHPRSPLSGVFVCVLRLLSI